IEIQLQPGFTSFGTTDDRITYGPAQLPADGSALPAIDGSGIALRASVGYRFTPWISAGLTVGVQAVPAAQQFIPSEAMLGAHDSFSSWQLGIYGRVYPLALANGSRDNPRVFFTGPADLRRLEPWLSLGVDFLASISRTRTYSDLKNGASWTTSYVGVPV